MITIFFLQTKLQNTYSTTRQTQTTQNIPNTHIHKTKLNNTYKTTQEKNTHRNQTKQKQINNDKKTHKQTKTKSRIQTTRHNTYTNTKQRNKHT